MPVWDLIEQRTDFDVVNHRGAVMNSPRIVIYGTGQHGLNVTRFALQKGWPIVAAFNRAGPKVGQDLGRLAGLDHDIGVRVQDCDTASYASFNADIGVVTASDRLKVNFPAYQRLIGAGLNVICHGGESYFPHGSDPETAAQIDALAKAYNVTFTGGGIWDMSRIWAGLLVAGPCTELHALHHASITDAQTSGRHLMLLVGVGMSVDEFTEKMVNANGTVGGMYKTIPQHVLQALGYTIEKVVERRSPVLFDEPYYCRLLERELAPGVVLGTRINIEVQTAEGVTADAQIELRVFKSGEVEHMTWAVDGMPRSRIRVERDDSALASSAALFNRIPDVIAAEPGIVPLSRLGVLRPTALAPRSGNV
jgi:hypothetical protein